jgi:uncharacterized protein (TIGR02145 family)
VGIGGGWWSSTQEGTAGSWDRALFYNNSAVIRSYDGQHYGFSVRCLEGEGQVLAAVTTTSATGITQTSATSGGNVTSDGSATISQRGICYSTSSNPTTANGTVIAAGFTGTFTSSLTGLTANTTYYIKAFATNNVGTSYGNELTFTTNAVSSSIPTLSTISITAITQTTATSGGNITNDGGATVTARGVCWSTVTSPSITDSKTSDLTGTGSYASNLPSLIPGTKYYVRAYATNSAGTAYGNELSFITTLTVNHTAGLVAPVTKTVTYGVIESNLTGTNKLWITQNLGADNQAGSAYDATEAAAGWYWQFNRKQGYKNDGINRTPNTTWITLIDEVSDWTAANDPCALLLGTGWRIPTSTEWNSAGLSGGWSSAFYTYSSVLKLHTAGFLNLTNGLLNSRGSYGYYWSSTQSTSTIGWFLYLNSLGSGMNTDYKINGVPVRCIKD